MLLHKKLSPDEVLQIVGAAICEELPKVDGTLDLYFADDEDGFLDGSIEIYFQEKGDETSEDEEPN